MKNKIFLCTALLSVLALCGCNQKAEESFSQSDISSTAETTTVSVSTSATTSTTTAISTSSAVATTTATTTTLKATATSESVTSVSDKVTETVKPDVTEDNSGNISIEDNGESKIIIEPIIEENQPIEIPDEMIGSDYNEDIYQKLGIKVNLTGTNEEQAHQYYEACKEAYPNLPWYDNGVNVSVDVSSLRSPDAPDIYSMSEDEYNAYVQERLAGRDYHDLSLEELAQIAADCGPGPGVAFELYNYFNDLTGRDFNAGGWTIIG